MARTGNPGRCRRALSSACLIIYCLLCLPPAANASGASQPIADGTAMELLVSVRFGRDMAAEQGAASGSIRYDREEERGQGMPVREVRVYQTPSRATTRQVRVLENHTAYFSIKESVPYPSAFSDDAPGRRYPYRVLEYRELKRGFAVRPHFSGGQLLLDISANNDRFSGRGGGIIDGTEVRTTIPAELNRWIKVGGTDTRREDRPGTYSTQRVESRDEEDQVWVMVERLD